MSAESESSPEPLPTTQEAQRFLTAALVVGLLVAAAAAMLLTWLGDEVLEGDALGLDNHARSLVHTSHGRPLGSCTTVSSTASGCTAQAGGSRTRATRRSPRSAMRPRLQYSPAGPAPLPGACL